MSVENTDLWDEQEETLDTCGGDITSAFDFLLKPYKITKPIRLIELFAGVGSQAMSLRAIGANFVSWKVVEFDPYAVKVYNAIHGTDFPVLDIKDVKGSDLEIVDTDKYEYVLTYSFPCQALSLAGKRGGMEEGSGTTSSLLWEVQRLLEECENLPQVLVMENVPQVHSDENMPHFQRWLNYLRSKGYRSYWQDMNAKDYGVAQNRERCICVSILGDASFVFPEGKPLDRKLSDYIEDEVDDRFYLKGAKVKNLIEQLLREGKIPGFEHLGTVPQVAEDLDEDDW